VSGVLCACLVFHCALNGCLCYYQPLLEMPCLSNSYLFLINTIPFQLLGNIQQSTQTLSIPAEIKHLSNQLHDANQQIDTLQSSRLASGTSTANDGETTILRVCQRIKDEMEEDGDSDEIGTVEDDSYEIWALIEYETDSPDNDTISSTFKRYKQWKKFTNESALFDYIRRDTGEPLSLPPYSLSPLESAKMAEEAKKAVASISEEFRRFRVRAEVAKKQADATVRALHSNSVQTTRMRIEGQDIESELAQAKTDHAKLAALRSEMAEQETRWKESYDMLLAENEKLKSSGAEALLAAQWRHRYEACLKEKEDAVTNLEMEREKLAELQEGRRKVDAGKYENKYRDLKVRCCWLPFSFYFCLVN
jgi:hypothetical protein